MGFHVHFLSDDRKAGGHVLQFGAEDAELSVAVVRRYTVQLPETEEIIVDPDRHVISQVEGGCDCYFGWGLNGGCYGRCWLNGTCFSS